MIERYTLKKMGQIWEEDNKLQKWLDIEILACEGWAKLGKIPQEAVEEIKAKAKFDQERIAEIEKITRHDVLAFLTNVAEYVGDASKHIHVGMTSSDILDTTLALQMREAADIILAKLEQLAEVLAARAREHKYTLMVGRTHGIHGEPVTFGLKLALWYDETRRSSERLKQAREVISYGKISGAVGTLANVDPAVEDYVCAKLGLKPAPVSTQIIQRDRHAQFVTTLALIAASLEKFATEIRNLQRTDILEVEEMFAKGQKGSSAMPHKRNPITSERVAGLARVIRGHAVAALENVTLWHERDLTNSSVERIIIPDSCILLDYILTKFIEVITGLQVYPANMEQNLNKTLGMVFSQRVLLALVDKGTLREDAYAWVQRNSMETWRTGQLFKEMILKDADIMSRLTRLEVDGLFDYGYHTKNVDYIFKRAGLE